MTIRLPELPRPLLAEAIGMFTLVFAGCGAIAAAAILRGSLGNLADVGATLPPARKGSRSSGSSR